MDQPGHSPDDDPNAEVFGVEYPQQARIVPLAEKGWVERIEELATAGFFLVMFGTLLAGIFWRYVLNQPLVWTVGISTLGFIWAALIGSGLSDRDDGHIQFDLLYNRVSERTQLVFRIVGNTIIVGTFALVIPATVDYLDFVGRQRVVGLPWLTFDWAYSAILLFFVFTIAHRGKLLWRDVMTLRRGGEERR